MIYSDNSCYVTLKLNNIFKNQFGIDFESLNKSDFQKDLLGNKHCFVARDLLYLFYEIEREFNIHISEDEILNGSFNCINNIRNIIIRALHSRDSCT